MVESLSGHLTSMLHASQLDLAVLFKTGTPQRLSIALILDEKLFVIAAAGKTPFAPDKSVKLTHMDLGFIAQLFLTKASGLA